MPVHRRGQRPLPGLAVAATVAPCGGPLCVRHYLGLGRAHPAAARLLGPGHVSAADRINRDLTVAFERAAAAGPHGGSPRDAWLRAAHPRRWRVRRLPAPAGRNGHQCIPVTTASTATTAMSMYAR